MTRRDGKHDRLLLRKVILGNLLFFKCLFRQSGYAERCTLSGIVLPEEQTVNMAHSDGTLFGCDIKSNERFRCSYR